MHKYLEEELEFLKQNYPTKGGKWCAAKLNRSQVSVVGKANRMGLKINYPIVNESLFINGSSEKNIAYICGFLWADGYFNQARAAINIEIVETDAKILYPILLKTGQWTCSIRQRKNWQPQWNIKTYNRQLYNFLESIGYKTNRNSFKKSLDFFDESAKSHWWRGYFDGDGCFSLSKSGCRKMQFSGRIDYDWTTLLELYLSIGVKSKLERRFTNSKKTHKASTITTTDIDSIRKFGNYIYRNSDNLRLERKFQKWQECIIDKRIKVKNETSY